MNTRLPKIFRSTAPVRPCPTSSQVVPTTLTANLPANRPICRTTPENTLKSTSSHLVPTSSQPPGRPQQRPRPSSPVLRRGRGRRDVHATHSHPDLVLVPGRAQHHLDTPATTGRRSVVR